MSSIRRLLSGISTSFTRPSSNVGLDPVAPPGPGEPLEPIAPVRRGFSDQSDFQAEAADGSSPFAAHLPHLEGRSTPSAPTPQSLRVFSGESSFEAAAPRYGQMLGSQLPSSLGAPREPSGGVSGLGGRRGAGAPDAADILSPDAAAWELQNLDTSTPTAIEPEDLLFMLDPPGASQGAVSPSLQLDFESDVFEDGVEIRGGLGDVDNKPGDFTSGTDPLDPAYAAVHGAQGLPPELLDPAVRPAGPDEFLADTNDLGDLAPDELTGGDAALAGVLGALAANPAAASVQVSSALASRGVETVAGAQEPDTFQTGEAGMNGQPPPPAPKTEG